MGVLSATGAAAVPADATGGADADATDQVDATDAADADPGADQGADQQADAPKPESRRQKATRELFESMAKPLREEFARERETDRRQYQFLEQRAQWLQQQLEAFQRQAPQGRQENQGPDPDELGRQAAAALTKEGGFAEYERLKLQEFTIRAERAADAKVKAAVDQLQRQIPQQQNPVIGTLLAKHQRVALAGARGEQAVGVKLNELKVMTNHDDRLPVSPQMMAKAFELADQWLEQLDKPAQRATFGQDASAVSGPSASRSGNGAGSGTDVELTAPEKAAMVAGGFKNAEEYIKWRDPSKWAKKW